MKKILNFLWGTLLILLFPLTLFFFLREFYIFRRNISIMNKVINNNNDFFNFLDKNAFIPDYLGRLYSPQIIPVEFEDFTEDELYDVVMRAMVTSLQHILNKNILLDVCGITTYKKSKEHYVINITSANEYSLKIYFKYFIWSFAINLITIITLIII